MTYIGSYQPLQILFKIMLGTSWLLMCLKTLCTQHPNAHGHFFYSHAGAACSAR